jgi:hypothetical protein
MTTKEIDKFSPLWGVDAKKYVLLRLHRNSSELKDCLIFNKETKSAKIIEDAELALEVRRRMVEAGVEMVSELPIV